jgi:hypothetical protein
MVDEQCMVIMSIVWWMNLQMYDAFCWGCGLKAMEIPKSEPTLACIS